MRIKPTYKIPFKRRRLGKTNYKKRLKILLSKKPRLVVRKSLKYITAQIIKFEQGKSDITVVSATSKELKNFNWKYSFDNLPASYLTGLIIAKKALKNNIKEAILDIGLQTSRKGARVYAVAKGAIDAGLKVNVDEKMFPSEERIKGLHIESYIPKFKNISTSFEKIKEKIMENA